MAKLLFLLAVCFFVQVSYARDEAETFNANIREQLHLYDKFQKEPDSANYNDDLKKLVELTEGALKAESFEEKNQILSAAPSNFSPEFNKWISLKLEETQVNADIHSAIEFYQSLLNDHAEHEADIKKTVGYLENLLVETDLKKKEENFLALDKTFSAEFQQFMKDHDLAGVNGRLETTAAFFEKLLNDKDIKFAKEIQDLKAKTEAALANNVSVDDKSKVLQEVRFTGNEELDAFLYNKNNEYSKV